MRAGKYVNGRSATLAYRLSGSGVHRLAETLVSRLEGWTPNVRRARKDWAAGGVRSVVGSLAVIEAAGNAMPMEVARDLEAELSDAQGRQRLSEAASSALADSPDSPILLYLRVLGLIDDNRFEEAHDILSAAFHRLSVSLNAGNLSATKGRERAESLSKLWKIVDSAARDQMRWVVPDADHGAAYARFDFVREFEALPHDRPWQNHLTTLAFAEPLLQGRQNSAYLKRCALAFEQTKTLYQRLQVIRAMCRQGVRRIPDYGPAYDQARALYNSCLTEMEAAIEQGRTGRLRDLRAHLRWLRSARDIAVQIGEVDHAKVLTVAIADCARGDAGGDGLWMVANALAQDPESRSVAVDLVRNVKPEREQDLRDFYQFVIRTGEYDRAHAVFKRLPESSQTRQSALGYATILQRSHRFEEAEKVVRAVHAKLLSNVDALDHFISYGLFRRAGELRFATETARYYGATPQPDNPKGVILVTARSFEQLRRTPIVTLLEWKRKGWAVVPIFEGILPLQKTDVEAIDRFAGCVRLTNELRDDADEWLAPVEPWDADFANGSLKWRGIDMSHAFWEEAAISRRVYGVTWSCPALKRSLANLVGWTDKTTRVLETARSTFGQLGLRCGALVLSSFRLPDAVGRFYCDAFGDARDFFCIQASNGYENYFTNFQKNISTRLTIRNMTAHPGVRSSSMPLASHVTRTMSEDRASVERSTQILLETARSKPHGHRADAAREEAYERITRWKASGGRVACAFGRVICDSGVPYDGGPSHASLKDWVQHTIECVAGSRTMLVIKPHPHELREEVACFLNETFRDLLPKELPENVIYLGHDWFETHELEEFVDLALIYSGTTAVEMALLGVPTVLTGYFGPIDYPLGHAVPEDREDYRRLVRLERKVAPPKDGPLRAAAWLTLMGSDDVSVPYRYHSRQITNCVVYPPFWFSEEIEPYLSKGDANVTLLAERGISVEE